MVASWAEEIFADAYGCLSAGPAFAFSLADTLAADRATVNSEQEAHYPSHSLRICLNCALLRETAHAERAAELWDQWSSQYPEPYPWSPFKNDLDTVAKGLLNVRIHKATGQTTPLRDVLEFPISAESDARKYEDKVRGNIDARPPGLRTMWAAARNAYDSGPAAFAEEKKDHPSLSSRFSQRMRAACLDNLRSGELPVARGSLAYLKELGEGFMRQAGEPPGVESS